MNGLGSDLDSAAFYLDVTLGKSNLSESKSLHVQNGALKK